MRPLHADKHGCLDLAVVSEDFILALFLPICNPVTQNCSSFFCTGRGEQLVCNIMLKKETEVFIVGYMDAYGRPESRFPGGENGLSDEIL